MLPLLTSKKYQTERGLCAVYSERSFVGELVKHANTSAMINNFRIHIRDRAKYNGDALKRIEKKGSKLPTPFDNLLPRHYQNTYFNPSQAPKGEPGERNRDPSSAGSSS